MKNGKSIIVVSLCTFALTYYMRNKSFQKLQQKNTNPTINQYLNRLREFFEVDILDQAEDEFLTLVDFGLSPNSAFESTIGYK